MQNLWSDLKATKSQEYRQADQTAKVNRIINEVTGKIRLFQSKI